MMATTKLFWILCLVILFAAPLALATTLQTAGVYPLGTAVPIAGTCDSPNQFVGLQYGYGSPLITLSVDQVASAADKSYSATYLPPQKGSYRVYAACQGEGNTYATFCVGTADECSSSSSSSSSSSGSSSSSSSGGTGGGNGGGGGGGSAPIWECTPWEKTYCNASLLQTRTCIDTTHSRKDRYETQNCTACDESWICTQFSACQNGKQTRGCVDEHYCKTTKKMPVLEKSCQAATVGGYAPSSVVDKLPPAGKTPGAPPSEEELSFLGKYWVYLVAIPLALILIAVAVWLIIRQAKKSASSENAAENIDQLKDWVSQEKAAGKSAADIKKAAIQSGWTEQEIKKVLK